MDQQQAAQPQNAVGPRIVAALIDIVILAVVFALMVWLFGEHETVRSTTTGDGFQSDNSNTQFNLTGLPLLAYLAIVIAYYLGFEAITRATPGKLVMGLRVVSMTNEPLTFGRIVLRTVLRIVDGLPFLYVVGLITIAASKNHQRVGDMAAGTNVAKARTSAPLPTDPSIITNQPDIRA